MSFSVLPKHKAKRLLTLFLAVLLVAGLTLHLFSSTSYGAPLGPRSLELSKNTASDTSDYDLTLTLSTADTLGSVLVQFCSNDPLPNTPCTAPGGFSDSAAVLSSQSGPGDFTISNASTANQLILTRTASVVPVEPLEFNFTGVINPSAPGSYYVRLITYASEDTSGPDTDYGGIAYLIMSSINITAEVPPYLIFCTGVTISGLNCNNALGDFIDLGELSSTSTRSGTSQLLVATNSASGYSVTAGGTTMTSGNNVIQALASGDVSRPGAAQFGFNLTANSTPAVGAAPVGPGHGFAVPSYNQPNIFRFNNGDVILSQPAPDITRVYTASYLVNVPLTQAPGVYVTTLTYVCLANF